jgi:hypothetical protein
MALITQHSRCAICNSKLDRPYTATSGIAPDIEADLFEFCDAPLHLDCLETWPHRDAFARAYFVAAVRFHEHPLRGVLLRTDTLALVTGPAPRGQTPDYAAIHLRDWPLQLYSKWNAWTSFVDGGFRTGWSGQALHAATEAVRVVAAVAPDLAALRALHAGRQHTVDWEEVDRQQQALLEARHAAEADGRRALEPHNESCRRLAARLQRFELACPRCGRRSRDFDFVDRSPRAKSCLVCRHCGRSFYPDDVGD